MTLSTDLVLDVVEVVIYLIMTVVVAVRKKRPEVAIAWLAVIYVMPWLGLLLYLLVGEMSLTRRRLRKRLKRHRTLDAMRQAASGSGLGPGFELARTRGQVLGDFAPLARLAMRHGGMEATPGNSVQVLSDSGAFIERLVADIDAARHHAHLLFYIYRDDKEGRRVASALARAAARGVACRVLVDAVGSAGFFEDLSGWLERQGVETVACLPVSPLRLHLARVDIRNHRKLAVIDGRLAYTGSQNIVEETFGHRKAGAWRDVMVRIEGPAACQLQAVFVEDYYNETERLLDSDALYPCEPKNNGVAVQVVPTGPDMPSDGFQDLLAMAIGSAKRQVTITSPYLVPDEGLSTALRLASARGVEVSLIVPVRSDHPVVDLVTAHYLGQLMEQGASAHLFQDGMLHAKIMTVDDTLAMVGTANFDIRSFALSLEIVLFLYEQPVIDEIKALQESYKAHAARVDPAAWRRRPWPRQLAEDLAKVLSPLL